MTAGTKQSAPLTSVFPRAMPAEIAARYLTRVHERSRTRTKPCIDVQRAADRGDSMGEESAPSIRATSPAEVPSSLPRGTRVPRKGRKRTIRQPLISRIR